MHRDGDRLLQLLIFNEEFLVSACHQRALITSLPFVHTARRSYRLNDPVRPPDCGNAAGSPSAMPREAVQTLSFRGRRSRNKVSVGEPAEGSLPVFPPALERTRGVRVASTACVVRCARVPPCLSGSGRCVGALPPGAVRVWRVVLCPSVPFGAGAVAHGRSVVSASEGLSHLRLGARLWASRLRLLDGGVSLPRCDATRVASFERFVCEAHNSCRWISWLSQR